MKIYSDDRAGPKGSNVRSTSVFQYEKAQGHDEDYQVHQHSFHKSEPLAQKYLDRVREVNTKNNTDKSRLIHQYITHRSSDGAFAPVQGAEKG